MVEKLSKCTLGKASYNTQCWSGEKAWLSSAAWAPQSQQWGSVEMGSASSKQELVREFSNANPWQRSQKEVSIRPLGKGEVRMCRNVDRKQDMRGWG